MKTMLIAWLLFESAALGQEAPVYRLSFAIHEMDHGKSTGARTYTMLVSPQANAKLNVGTKLPVPAGSTNNGQYTYVDVGVSLRAKVQERGPQLLLTAEVEVSNLGAEREDAGRPAPRIQQLRADIDTAIPLGHAVAVVELDDPASPKHYEIEVTATKVK